MNLNAFRSRNESLLAYRFQVASRIKTTAAKIAPSLGQFSSFKKMSHLGRRTKFVKETSRHGREVSEQNRLVTKISFE